MSEQEESSASLNSRRREMEKKMSDKASSVLTEFRLGGKLCDVVMKVGNTEFNAHKIILCSCSSYFRALFTGAWATSNKQIYTIPGVTPEMMQLIINYAYTRSVTVTEDNVLEVLATADQFLVPGIIHTCCLFLEEQLCPKNCIGIWRLVDFYHCPELKEKVFLYILHRFEEIVCVSQELLDLSVRQLGAIVENDHLNVKGENTVFEAVLGWINHLPEQRRLYISVLLRKVRLGLMTPSYLQNNVIDNAVIKDCVECTSIINDAVTACMDFRASGRSKSLYSNLLTRPRLPSAILLVTGSVDARCAPNCMEAYDSRADSWVTVSTEQIWRTHHGAAVLNNVVYLIGGCSHEVYFRTVQKFDLVTRTWHQVAPMYSHRCYISVAVLNGCIYAIGGFNGHTYYKTVECYKPETDQWNMIAPMTTKRCGASATTLNGKVYVCGGFNGHHSLCTAECYDPNTNQWTMIAPMRSCRSGLGVAAYRGRIYAVGGTIGNNSHLRSAEAYNLQTDRWSNVPSMYSPRSYFGIEVVDDQLFVVGGHNGSTTLLAVERYDEEAGMWYSASDTVMPHSGLSCCVLHGLYSVAEDLFPRGPLTEEDPQLC